MVLPTLLTGRNLSPQSPHRSPQPANRDKPFASPTPVFHRSYPGRSVQRLLAAAFINNCSQIPASLPRPPFSFPPSAAQRHPVPTRHDMSLASTPEVSITNDTLPWVAAIRLVLALDPRAESIRSSSEVKKIHDPSRPTTGFGPPCRGSW